MACRPPRVVVGVDFGAPRRARDQRRKIVALAAELVAPDVVRMCSTGINERLVVSNPPGWSASELVEELVKQPAHVVGFDFPFSLPIALLDDAAFAAAAGHGEGAFGTWQRFHRFVARNLPITDPLDFAAFEPWRDPSRRATTWAKRATDRAMRAQPPLKDVVQATFQMTLLGNAMLSALRSSGLYHTALLEPAAEADVASLGTMIEVYPGATLRAFGLQVYKANPGAALELARRALERAGLTLEIAPEIMARCHSYDSGGRAPDHDAADAFVALCTAILHARGSTRAAMGSMPAEEAAALMAREGAIWVPELDA